MTARYSASGYVAAIRMRSAKTILVEGPTDRDVVRMVIRCGSPRVIVEDASMIRSQPGAFGAREKVLLIAQINKGAGELRCLVDRDWEGFSVESTVVDAGPSPVSLSVVRTRGHSIENYFLTAEMVRRFVTHITSFEADIEPTTAVIGDLIDVMRMLSALSWAFRSVGLLSRSREVVRQEHWSRVDGRLILDLDGICKTVQDRGTGECDTAALCAMYITVVPVMAATDPAVLRWFCHGHVGENGLWSAVAFLLAERGATVAAVATVNGNREERRRVLASHLPVDLSASDPLLVLMEFAQS